MATAPAYTDAYLVDAHRHCAIHGDEVNSSTICGCFYCLETFPPAAIVDWLNDRIQGTPGRTALCPKCAIDSVIGSGSGFPITREFLAAMHERWFEGTGIPE